MAGSGLAAWASSYAALGWRVFPAYGKVPAFRGWQQAATTDPALIARWWPRDGVSNVALVTGEAFDVFDVEAAHLFAFLGHVRDGRLPLPPTPVANTGRGGLHIYVKPTGVDGTRRLFLDGAHIGELKSRGGLVLAPPSATTGQYTWQYAPESMTLHESPDWLVALVAKPEPTRDYVAVALDVYEQAAALEALAQAVAGTQEGNRNDVLYWAARRAVEEGIPSQVAGRALARAAVAAGLHLDDGGPKAIDRTLTSAFEAAP